MRDCYCPNCRQMVRPKLAASSTRKALIVLCFAWGALLMLAWGEVLFPFLLAAVAAWLVVALFGARMAVRSCPICGSASLEAHAPV